MLETLHYGLASRRMITWSRSLSPIRKQLSFLDAEDQSEDLIDVGDDDDGLEWKVVKILTYRWSRTKEGRWAVSDTFACLMNQRAAMTGDLYWPSSSSISGPYDAVMMACTVSNPEDYGTLPCSAF